MSWPHLEVAGALLDELYIEVGHRTPEAQVPVAAPQERSRSHAPFLMSRTAPGRSPQWQPASEARRVSAGLSGGRELLRASTCSLLPPRWPAVANCPDRLTVLVRFAAIFLEPLRADRAEIIFAKRAMTVHPDHDCGHSRQPENVNHEVPPCGQAGVL